MPSPDLAEPVTQLRALGDDFAALDERINTLTVQPGTDALQKITPLLLSCQQLTAAALHQLTTLNTAAYTTLPGSRQGLDVLSATVAGAALAGADLAAALSVNPFDASGFDTAPAGNDAAARRLRQQDARPEMVRRFTDAAQQLSAASSACHYLATGIAQAASPTQAGPPHPAAVNRAAPDGIRPAPPGMRR
ncbi:hypothetical protein ACFYVL_09455 [Streptomyces sp. NPDC004111]|uniref:hypothetical protein n=1 Tax=Streptomyces sp. NPDC004111 TaxID=3364690 RepID=UPI0036CFDD22